MIEKQHKRTELQPTMHEQADSTAYVCSVSKPHMQYVRGALAAELASDGKDYNDHSTTMNSDHDSDGGNNNEDEGNPDNEDNGDNNNGELEPIHQITIARFAIPPITSKIDTCTCVLTQRIITE